MRITIDEEKQIWTIQDVGEFEWYLLSQLPATADPSQSAKGRNRLLPDAVDPAEDPDGAADWREFVSPELEDRFASNVAIVSNALENAQEEESENGIHYEMEMALEDVETWFLVLNQARLILNEDHDAAGMQETLEADGPDGIEEGLALPLAKYEFYTAIQSYLIARVMDKG